MAGAIAGSVILELRRQTPDLELITLTVNNTCNLQCPHCYLQYDAHDEYVCDAVVDRIMESSAARLAIVGKEPFVSRAVAQRTWRLMNLAVRAGKRVSVVTNGFGLQYLPAGLSDDIDFVDVSFDGGPETYSQYRKASFSTLAERIGRHVAAGFRRFRALAVLSTATLHAIDDIMRLEEIDGVEFVMMSPYLPTSNNGVNNVRAISLDYVLKTLAACERFRDSKRSLLLIAAHELRLLGEDVRRTREHIEALGLTKQVAFVENDPLQLGIIRVNYDGLAMTPLQSLHPALYRRDGIPVANSSLVDLFHRFKEGAGSALCGSPA